MTNLRRIRIDEFGLLTQSVSGKMDRVLLGRPTIAALKGDPEAGLRALHATLPDLGPYFDEQGRLAARVDVADEPVDCLSRPLRIYYNIEPNCNLNCSFCGPRDLHGLSEKASKAREDFLLDQIAQAGSFQVQLTGGEIFIRGRKLFATLERTRDLGLATLLGTNGVWTHITDRESFLRDLAEFDHIIEVKVSVDGTREFHDSVRGLGSYDEAVRTLLDLSRNGFNTRINTTIFKQSCTTEQIEHLARLAQAASASLQAIPERSCGRSRGKTTYELPPPDRLRAYTIRAKQLREELGVRISFNFDIFGGGGQLPHYDPGRPFSCGAGLWGFAVTHLGEVYPCGFAIELGDPGAFLVGTISPETSLLDLWLHSELLRRWRYAGKSPRCMGCDHYRQTCWGGVYDPGLRRQRRSERDGSILLARELNRTTGGTANCRSPHSTVVRGGSGLGVGVACSFLSRPPARAKQHVATVMATSTRPGVGPPLACGSPHGHFRNRKSKIQNRKSGRAFPPNPPEIHSRSVFQGCLNTPTHKPCRLPARLQSLATEAVDKLAQVSDRTSHIGCLDRRHPGTCGKLAQSRRYFRAKESVIKTPITYYRRRSRWPKHDSV